MRKGILLSALLLTACAVAEEPQPPVKPPEVCEELTAPATQSTPSEPTLFAMDRNQPEKRFIVKLKPGDESHLPKSLGTLEDLGDSYFALTLREESTSSMIAQALPEFESIEPDVIVHTTFVSNDEGLSKQWAHAKVHSAQAWDISLGSDDVIVAVLDTGVDYTHPDLAANIWTNRGEIPGNGIDDDRNGYIDDVHGWNFVKNNNRPMADDDSFHGTHVAGTIGAVGNNRIGVAGHAQRVKIMPLKFLSADGSGSTSDAIKGINYAIKMKAKIINNSWGATQGSQALSAAIDRARAAGILFVAAAGNNGSNNDASSFYPANYPQDNVISVAASDSKDSLASFSNFGPKKVALAAPGASIYSTKNGSTYQYLSGTSMATPLISGVLATMIAARPNASYAQIKNILLGTVDKLATMKGKIASGGRVNSYKALSTLVLSSGKWTPPSKCVP